MLFKHVSPFEYKFFDYKEDRFIVDRTRDAKTNCASTQSLC
jgi:hypothetical protein